MLKDIQKAITKAFNELDVQLTTNNEAYEDRETFAFILAADIFRELNTQQTETPKRAPRKKKADEPEQPETPQQQPTAAVATRTFSLVGAENE